MVDWKGYKKQIAERFFDTNRLTKKYSTIKTRIIKEDNPSFLDLRQLARNLVRLSNDKFTIMMKKYEMNKKEKSSSAKPSRKQKKSKPKSKSSSNQVVSNDVNNEYDDEKNDEEDGDEEEDDDAGKDDDDEAIIDNLQTVIHFEGMDSNSEQKDDENDDIEEDNDDYSMYSSIIVSTSRQSSTHYGLRKMVKKFKFSQ